MKSSKGLPYLIATVASIIILLTVTGFYGVRTAFFLFPIFAVAMYLYSLAISAHSNLYFAGYLLAAMITEILFLYDYERFVVPTVLFSVITNIFLLLIIKPALYRRATTFSKHNILELVIGFIGVGFVLGYIIVSVLPLMSDVGLFAIGVVTFLIAVMFCFITPNVNRHPVNSLLYGVGGASLIEMSFAFLYKYISADLFFLLGSILMGCFVKLILAKYTSMIDEIKNYDSNLDV